MCVTSCRALSGNDCLYFEEDPWFSLIYFSSIFSRIHKEMVFIYVFIIDVRFVAFNLQQKKDRRVFCVYLCLYHQFLFQNDISIWFMLRTAPWNMNLTNKVHLNLNFGCISWPRDADVTDRTHNNNNNNTTGIIEVIVRIVFLSADRYQMTFVSLFL